MSRYIENNIRGAGARANRPRGCIATHISAPATFLIRVRPQPGVDPIRALRSLLKLLGRRFGLRAVSVEVEGHSYVTEVTNERQTHQSRCKNVPK